MTAQYLKKSMHETQHAKDVATVAAIAEPSIAQRNAAESNAKDMPNRIHSTTDETPKMQIHHSVDSSAQKQ